MKPDPGIERTREVRTLISHEHGNDLRRLVEYYLDYQRRFSERLRWAPGTHEELNEIAEQGHAADDASRRG